MRSTAKSFDDIRRAIADHPVVDCHEHMTSREKSTDLLRFLSTSYVNSDLASAVGMPTVERIADEKLPVQERWPDFERAFRAARFTSYGNSVRRAMVKLFGSDEITLDRVPEWQKMIPDYSDEKVFESIIAESHVVARVTDNWPPIREIVDGTFRPLPNQYMAIPLPEFHGMKNRLDFGSAEAATRQTVTSLDEYLAMCFSVFTAWKDAGAVCFKDQSAYGRQIAYEMPPRADAERIFNRILADPRYSAEYDPYASPLSDYLMHAFIRMAREMELPVQVHTGHMAGHRNDVAKTNAAGLRSLLEVHRDVRFDLFHANWPYAGDLLFLAKNYANVSIDMCWAYAIDPIYCKDLLKRIVVTVPYTKVHGYGTDVGGSHPHMVWAYSEEARDIIAAALSELVAEEYISVDDSLEIASAWLYGNARRFFGLPIPE